jgi:hypothetical protein
MKHLWIRKRIKRLGNVGVINVDESVCRIWLCIISMWLKAVSCGLGWPMQ